MDQNSEHDGKRKKKHLEETKENTLLCFFNDSVIWSSFRASQLIPRGTC